MSILIRGMKMPETCSDCDLYQYGFCMVTRNVCDNALMQRQDDCPLIEVQSPHGRLVDRDVLMTEVMDSDLDHLQRDDWKEVIQIVADAPTIIEAEGQWRSAGSRTRSAELVTRSKKQRRNTMRKKRSKNERRKQF